MNNSVTVSLSENESIELVKKLYTDEPSHQCRNVPIEPDSKKIKQNSNETSIHILTCDIDWKRLGKESFKDVPVMISMENDNLIIVDNELTPLFNISSISTLNENQLWSRILAFGTVHYSLHKYNDRLNKLKSNILNLKLQKDKSSKLKLKNDTKKINDVNKHIRYLKKQLKNIDLKSMELSTSDNTVKLSLQIWLHFERNHTSNKFNKETISLLHDLLCITQKRNKENILGINSPFIERQFITQTIQYTKEKLNNEISKDTINVPNLNVELLPFQQQSLKWLLTKEGYYDSPESYHNNDPTTHELLSYLNDEICYGYSVIDTDSTETFFWNKFTNFILDMPYVKELYSKRNINNTNARGLLCEEMGLGKTIEILSLLLLNKRIFTDNEPLTYLNDLGKKLLRCKTTLIICPNPLLQQWINEIIQHTTKDTISIFHYQGYNDVKDTFNTDNIDAIVKRLSKYDVIITTYNVINLEIHYTQYNANQRSRRNVNNVPRYDYSSPLSLMQFFRIILNEVQMLKSDNTQAAKCTSLLDRVHTWGVSGTPIQNVKDLQTVLSYLKIQPFCNMPEIITNVSNNIIEATTTNQRRHTPDSNLLISPVLKNGSIFSIEELLNIFLKYDICIRHIKDDVISQIHVPKQTNYLIPLEFNPVEWDNYINTWDDFMHVSGYGSNGQNKPRLSTIQLNQWLMKLRYLCCHAVIPENIVNMFSNRSRHRSLKKNQLKGNKLGQLDNQLTSVHNINDILQLMTINATELLDSLFRENIQLQVKAAQAKMELQNQPTGAITLFSTVIEQIKRDLKEKFNVDDPFNISYSKDTNNDRDKDVNDAIIEREESAANKVQVRAYLDLLHQCIFFTGTAYYFLGSKKLEEVDDINEKAKLVHKENKDASPLEIKEYTDVYSSEEMDEIYKNQLQEQMYYEKAEQLRRFMLKERSDKIDETIKEVNYYFEQTSKSDEKPTTELEIIEFESEKNYSSNFLSQKIFKSLCGMIASLNSQANQFNELIAELKTLLYKPISKEYTSENEEEKAEEYGSSIDDQDKIFAYLHCLEEILKNRDLIINSEDDKIKLATKNIVQIDPNYSEFHVALIKKLNLIKEGVSLKSTFSELKNSKIVRNSVKSNAIVQNDSFEDYLLGYESEIKRIKDENGIARESMKKLNVVYNSKVEYFTQLQRISDSLVSLIRLEPVARNAVTTEIRTHKKYNDNIDKINQTESRVKYLKNLRKLKELIDQNKSFTCSICLGIIYLGSILKCGHFFCKNCIHNWLKHHHTCPICKQETTKSEVYNFKFKNEDAPPNNVINSKPSVNDSKSDVQLLKRNKNIPNSCSASGNELFSLSDKYSRFLQMSEVHKIKIKENFGAKIDFVIKLILFLKLRDQARNKSPPQILLYSQNIDFLKIITHILQLNNIKYLEGFQNKKNSSTTIDRFKTDPNITCLLLNVRTLGSGLNLLNAKHIFLLDPIINHGDELQATSRNNRIGQTEETFVWNFMMMDSVEENIMLYKHALEHNKTLLKKKDDKIEASTINDDAKFEINADSTEMVAEKHLWNCLFRSE
ncbi:hypothetical protein C6P45_005004 [Maudiozyma exigua]|uniref:RING-type domain-containing protein n=1 Tax=Maudiozyma exigua TaxID=34358 RepID=A0A9P6W9R9_MAUEX|nr:hypothetical protein C6P45_005004 [Kazachstania exigua]